MCEPKSGGGGGDHLLESEGGERYPQNLVSGRLPETRFFPVAFSNLSRVEYFSSSNVFLRPLMINVLHSLSLKGVFVMLKHLVLRRARYM